MTSHDTIIKNFFIGTGAKTGSTVFWKGDKLYSYGEHFTLCQRIAPNRYIINADKYSVTTNKHTHLTINNAPTNTPCIPFSALSIALSKPDNFGDFNKINLIEVGQPFYTKQIKHLDKSRYDIKEVAEEIKANGWTLIKETDKKIIVTVPMHHLGYTLFEYDKEYYLSGMDDNHYFLCRLLYQCDTIDKALLSMAGNLTDKEYREYQKGTIKRQGEFFFIPMPELTFNKELIKKKAPIPQAQGTASHIATSLRVADGYIYAKGLVSHSRRDHRSIHLDTWHKVVLNTVKESWTSNGRVD
jgi:hypothetical protein